MGCFVVIGVGSSVIARACFLRSIFDKVTPERGSGVGFERITELTNMITVEITGTAIIPCLVERAALR